MRSYASEIEGQREFYSRVGIEPDLSHSTDGVDKGNLYENKLDISNIYKVLLQAIKYASRIRIRGEKLPANIILNDLNKEIVYIFKSEKLLADIEKVYFGAASKNNEEYNTDVKYQMIDYSSSKGLQELLVVVNSEEYVRYHVDCNNILGLSQQFYKIVQDKDKFIKGENAEIRKPNILADRIYPYEKEDNIEFEDIMDCLNPGLLQREQGAYYTPPAYVAEMHKMLYKAIEEVPEGMDYIIIDRCAGTGNLQEGLPDEVLKHCVLSTIEFNEYAILSYKYGDKCLVVIPNTDALAFDIIPAEKNQQGICNEFIREKVTDKNCVVILMENPPYSEAGSGGAQNTGKKENLWKKSYVLNEMKKEVSGVALNELSNLFIWSAFKYYLTKETDSYILFSPTKYWRNQELVNKKFEQGFLCNRKWFHATQVSAVGCIWWKNIDDRKTESILLPAYDIILEKAQKACNDIVMKKAHHNFTEAYDNRKFSDDEAGIMCDTNGTEFTNDGRKISIFPIYNTNIIAYMMVHSFLIDRKNVSLTRMGLYKGHGFYVREDNFVEKLPLFVAATFPYDKWYKTDIYSKTYDGKGSYLSDDKFLMQCLLYTALTSKNKCRSFVGSDGRIYQNSLCFDKQDTIAWNVFQQYMDKGMSLSDEEKTLLKYWDDVIFEVSKTAEYKNAIMQCEKMRYGLFQIMEEINIKIDSERLDKNGKPVMVYKYSSLNTEINKINSALKLYYQDILIPQLFKYELLK